MKVSPREAASMLNISETTIYRWVDDGEIPFTMVHHHPMFHRVELLEWAMSKELPISVDLYEDVRDTPLARALERGGGRGLDGDLARIADDLPIADPAERDSLAAIIVARSSAMFVRRADGIAIPAARSPLICAEGAAAVLLWWGAFALDGKPTTTLFAIVAPTIKQHLQLLSRLSLLLHDKPFNAAVQRRGDVAGAIAEARRLELAIATARQGDR